MKDKLIITITDIKGSKQYNIHQFVKHVLLYFGLLVLAVIIVAFSTIRLLLTEVATIEENRNKLVEDYNRIEEMNRTLDAIIVQKNSDLGIIRERLGSLEGFIGVGLENTQESKNPEAIEQMLERVDVAKMTAEQKGFTMRMIPSGSPVKQYQISSPFGNRSHPLMKRQEFHTGVDMRVPMNTPIYAPADGIVFFSKKGYNGGYGNMVKISHAYGFQTAYAHLDKPVAKEGDFVKKGQLIAYSGNSGLSTGPHLHYEVLFLGTRLNPKPFLDWTMRNYDDILEKEKKIKWQSLLHLVDSVREIVSDPDIE